MTTEIKECQRDWDISVTSETGQKYEFSACSVKLKPGVLFYDILLEDGKTLRFCHACVSQFDLKAKEIVATGVVDEKGSLRISPNTAEGVLEWRAESLRVQKARQAEIRAAELEAE